VNFIDLSAFWSDSLLIAIKLVNISKLNDRLNRDCMLKEVLATEFPSLNEKKRKKVD
jgi:hypothetical protein